MNNQNVISPATTMLPAPKASRARTTRQKHGLSGVLKGRLHKLDGRSELGQAMSAFKADLLSSLGGSENLSAQRLCFVDLAVKEWLILQTIDGFFSQAGFFQKRKKTAYPLLASRMQVADGLKRSLLALGLERKAKKMPTLQELLAMPSKPLPDRTESTVAGS